MDRRFGLPIAFAAALHGAVLFGFNRTPRAEPPVKDGTTVIPFVLPPALPEDPVVVEDLTQDTAAKSAPDAPAPIRSPEPVAIEVPNTFKISPPPVSAVDTSNMNLVPPTDNFGRRGNGDNPWGNIISSTLLDNTPRTRLQAAPLYPFEAKRDGLSGEVVVEFIVDESGSVIEPRVVRSSHRVFEEASLRAVAKWKFEAGRRDGRVVRFRMAVPVVFNLNE